MWSHGVWAEWLTCLFVPIDHALGDQVPDHVVRAAANALKKARAFGRTNTEKHPFQTEEECKEGVKQASCALLLKGFGTWASPGTKMCRSVFPRVGLHGVPNVVSLVPWPASSEPWSESFTQKPTLDTWFTKKVLPSVAHFQHGFLRHHSQLELLLDCGTHPGRTIIRVAKSTNRHTHV